MNDKDMIYSMGNVKMWLRVDQYKVKTLWKWCFTPW